MESPPQSQPCPICAEAATLLDVVDFNKSCAESWGKVLPPSGVPIAYYLCDACGHCHAPEFRRWTQPDFAERIYNTGYAEVDPDYSGARPAGNAATIEQLFGRSRRMLRHLDYGGGAGLLSRKLGESGWNTASYDPFVDPPGSRPAGSYDLITLFEVFEHVPDALALVRELGGLLSYNGLLFLSTLLSDGEIARGERLKWWYASPRNGHISIYSRKSLALALSREGMQLASLNQGLHVAFRSLPWWAADLKPGA